MKNTTLFIRAAIVLLILSWSLQASAQGNPNLDEKLLYTSKYYKFKKMKTTGLVLSLAGGVLGIVGLSKMSNATYTTNSYGQSTTTDPDAVQGAAMFLIAIPMVGAGVPLAIVGNIKSKKYGALLEQTSLNTNFSPRGGGVTLTFRF